MECEHFNIDRVSVSFKFDELPDLIESVINDCREFLTLVLKKRLTHLGADGDNADKLASAFIKAFGFD